MYTNRWSNFDTSLSRVLKIIWKRCSVIVFTYYCCCYSAAAVNDFVTYCNVAFSRDFWLFIKLLEVGSGKVDEKPVNPTYVLVLVCTAVCSQRCTASIKTTWSERALLSNDWDDVLYYCTGRLQPSARHTNQSHCLGRNRAFRLLWIVLSYFVFGRS